VNQQNYASFFFMVSQIVQTKVCSHVVQCFPTYGRDVRKLIRKIFLLDNGILDFFFSGRSRSQQRVNLWVAIKKKVGKH